jgi:hypothetical protein
MQTLCGKIGKILSLQQEPNMDYALAHFNMIEQQIRPWDVLDMRILDVMAATPRHLFVPDGFESLAYSEAPIPLSAQSKMLEPKIIGTEEWYSYYRNIKVKLTKAENTYDTEVFSDLLSEFMGLCSTVMYSTGVYEPVRVNADQFEAMHKAATEITVSPAPETSKMFLTCAGK